MKLNKYIDHTCLKQGATTEDIQRLCEEAIVSNFAAVCIAPSYVSFAKSLLKDTDIKVCTVIGFPFGYSTSITKSTEIVDAIGNDVDEIDIVQNISFVKNGDWVSLYREINEILSMPIVRNSTKLIVKIILESGVLTDNEIIKCCEIYSEFNRIDFIKTSTGYAESGASVHQVELIKKHIPSTMQIKASGGIRDYKFAKELIDAGATRLGCSAGIKIINGLLEESKINLTEKY